MVYASEFECGCNNAGSNLSLFFVLEALFVHPGMPSLHELQDVRGVRSSLHAHNGGPLLLRRTERPAGFA